MQIYPKSTNELAAQFIDLYSMRYTLEGSLVPGQEELATQFDEARNKVLEQLNDGISVEELDVTLVGLYKEAERSGLVNPLKGERAVETHQKALKEYAWAPAYGLARAAETGYLGRIRFERKQAELDFSQASKSFVEAHPLEQAEDVARQETIRKTVIDIGTISANERAQLEADFPGGNFVFHSAKTQELIAMVDDGEILNYKAIRAREQAAAKLEGRDPKILKRNSGFEGISWSMNALDAVPSSRYHVAGFVGPPAKILKEGEQFAVPSRPAPYEVIQITDKVDAGEYYGLKVQLELYESPGMMGEENSVQSNLSILRQKIVHDATEDGSEWPLDEPMLMKFVSNHSDDAIATSLKDTFSIREDGTIMLGTKLYQQYEVPAAAAWLQGLIESERIKHVPGFEDARSVRDIVTHMDAINVNAFVAAYEKDSAYNSEATDLAERKFGTVSADISDMYLVAPKKDLGVWLKVLARTAHQPKGVLLYDDKKVRLENFAHPYTGDAVELTNELKRAIEPSEGYIDWEQDVLGEEISRDKRTGNNKQVIAEPYLAKRSVIRNSKGKLLVTKK